MPAMMEAMSTAARILDMYFSGVKIVDEIASGYE